MKKSRLEAFSDGVIAIILTIMVLELRPPAEGEGLGPLAAHFMSYALSFTYVAIYWVNRHHLFQAVEKVDGKVLWLNVLLLFSLSLFPFFTAWVGESHFGSLPVIGYGAALLGAALSYFALSRSLIALHGPRSTLARAVGEDRKGLISLLLYAAGTGCAFFAPKLGYAFYISVAFIWLVPDTRIEKRLRGRKDEG